MQFKYSIITLVLLLVLPAPFLKDLRISNVPNSYVPESLESRQLNDKVRSILGTDELLIIQLKANSILEPEFLANVKKFIDDIGEIENVKKIHSAFSYESISSDEEGFVVEDLIQSDQTTEQNRNRINSDLYSKFLVTKEGDQTLLIIEPIDISNSLERYFLYESILNKIEELKLSDSVEGIGGQFAIDIAQFDEMKRTMMTIVPITTVVGLIVLFALFGNLFACIIGITGNTVVLGIGLMIYSLMQWPYNLISGMLPSLVTALLVAFLVHLFNQRKYLVKKGEKASYREAAKRINKPTLFSAITTSVGILCLASSPIPSAKHLGLAGAVCVMLLYVFVIQILPAIIDKLPKSKWNGVKSIESFFDKLTFNISKLTSNRPKEILVFFLVALLLTVKFVFQIQTESNLFSFFPKDHYVNQSNQKIQDSFVGTTPVDIVIDKEVLSSEMVKNLYSLSLELEHDQEISRAFGYPHIIERLHYGFSKSESLKDINDEMIEQYLFMYDGENLYDFYNEDEQIGVVNLSVNKQSANEIEIVLNRIVEKANSIIGEGNYSLAGVGKIFSDQENLMMGSLIESIVYGLIAIFIIMIFLWKNVADALFCMVPNILPIIVMLIVMGAFGIWLDFGTAMIASVTLGIAIDDTIHIYFGLKERHSSPNRTYETLSESGVAVLATTIVLCAQFFILSFSHFSPVKYFGLLTMIGLFSALVLDLFILPSLYNLVRRK